MKTLFSILFVVIMFTNACKPSQNSVSKVATESIFGTSWQLKEVVNANFTANDFTSNIPKINFNSDGTLSGFDGCNSFNSSFKVNGNAIELGNIAATRKMCQGVKDGEFNQLLRKTNAFKIAKGQLSLMEGGSELMRFIKQ